MVGLFSMLPQPDVRGRPDAHEEAYDSMSSALRQPPKHRVAEEPDRHPPDAGEAVAGESRWHDGGVTRTRLEAFSDAVLAIIMTIMVLELTVPHGVDWEALRPLVHRFLTYLLSFVFLGIYWSNHHHLISTVRSVHGGILWANLHLLFWLSLTPFVTGWMGENNFAAVPTAAYGIVLLLAAVAYYILQSLILASLGPKSALRAALGKDMKGKVSPVCYLAAIPLAFVNRWISVGLYVFVALMWLVPDRRIERLFAAEAAESETRDRRETAGA
jgi:TMEM175 potassium channel family protein